MTGCNPAHIAATPQYQGIVLDFIAVSISRKHHFVPAFYLKQWAGTDGHLIQWSRPHKLVVPKRRHPDATGYEFDLNNFDDMPPQIATFMEDQFLMTADNEASLAVQSLLSNSSLAEPRLREAWAQFLISLPLRHPDVLREVRLAIHTALGFSQGQYQAHYETIRKPEMPAKFRDHLEQSLVGGRSQLVLRLLSGLMRNPNLLYKLLISPCCTGVHGRKPTGSIRPWRMRKRTFT